MALHKLDEYYPNYQEELFDGEDIKGIDVYAGKSEEKIGTIEDALVDDQGSFRYFVIDTGFWIFGKKVLLPVGKCHIDAKAKRIYAISIVNKKQVEDLPEYHESKVVDRQHEEKVRHVYSNLAMKALEEPTVHSAPTQAVEKSDRHDYNYQAEPSLYNLNADDHQTLKLYEERLIANKKRRQTGEVILAKHVETETASISLPLEKDRIVIERNIPADRTVRTPNEVDFQSKEIVRMKVYEESADIHKQAFVREEVRISKEVEQDIVQAQETIRREELDIDTKGRLDIDTQR
ncbi:DUF2382 domain-containing protein [Aliterella atlantica]|uniref:Photosystem reaction center subunit H n=1 Tax=Aliterella atlantica CENA595 TaxID=1618023 RepID=A0A0D8ZRL0_9CYAN|nr:DUF2382 domain-containing protein [Aliterella atlantica]KJH71360.1 photosystem reaction center subunit H [Aliterella atlantica CENA595]